MKETLVSIAEKWGRGEIDEAQTKELLKTIEIHDPVPAENELEATAWSIGNNNSWLEVFNKVLSAGVISDEKFEELVAMTK